MVVGPRGVVMWNLVQHVLVLVLASQIPSRAVASPAHTPVELDAELGSDEAGLEELASVVLKGKGKVYKLSINSDVNQGAGNQDTGVLIEILGGKGSTGTISLGGKQTTKHLLAPGTTTTAEVEAVDVGDINGIVVSTSLDTEWHCRDITVDGGDAGSIYTFKVNKFLHLQFQPSVHVARDAKYEITVDTGIESGAGTTGLQWVTVYGASTQTEPLPLMDPKTKATGFTAGQKYEFELTAVDVGPVRKIKLHSDSGDLWQCLSVSIVKDGTATNFGVDAWIGYPTATEVFVMADVTYELLVKTGSKPHPQLGEPSSTGEFYVTLVGHTTETRKRPLKTGFSAAGEDSILIKARDVGSVSQLKLSTESPDAWHCKSIDVYVDGVFDSNFVIDKWIKAPELTPVVAHADTEYSLSILTGKDASAGSDGEIFMSMFGSTLASRRVSIGTGLKAGGAVKNMVISAQDVGKIEKIVLETASGDDWYCESITISQGGASVHFVVKKWLVSPLSEMTEVYPAVTYLLDIQTGSDERASTAAEPIMTITGNKGSTHPVTLPGKYRIGGKDYVTVEAIDVGVIQTVTLQTNSEDDWFCESVRISKGNEKAVVAVDKWLVSPQAPKVVSTVNVEYSVSVMTGNLPKSETDGTIYLVIIGSLGETKRQPLHTGFQKGTTEIKFLAEDVGEVSLIEMDVESGDDWFCERIAIHRGSDKAHFTVSRWLSQTTVPRSRYSKDVTYNVQVNTADELIAGISDPLYIKLFGTTGATERQLVSSELSPASETKVTFTGKDIGIVQSVRFSVDAGVWVCKSVEVCKLMWHPANREECTTLVSTPVLVNKTDPLTLPQPQDSHTVLQKKPRKHTTQLYNVSIYHTMPKGMRTTWKYKTVAANTQWIILYGTLGQSSKISLGTGFTSEIANNVAVTTNNSLGILTKIRLISDSTDAWFVERVLVTHSSMQYQFTVDTWIASTQEPQEFTRDLLYTFTLTTGKRTSKGVTPRFRLLGSRGMTSEIEYKGLKGVDSLTEVKFTALARDVGEPSKMRMIAYEEGVFDCKTVRIRWTPASEQDAAAAKVAEDSAKEAPGATMEQPSSSVEELEDTVLLDIMEQGTSAKSTRAKTKADEEAAAAKAFIKAAEAKAKAEDQAAQDAADKAAAAKAAEIAAEGKMTATFVFEKMLGLPYVEMVEESREVDYTIEASTGDMMDAGSHGSFDIVLHGSGGSTRPRLLTNMFQKGQTQKYHLKARDVGQIKSVTLSTFSDDGWYCEKIVVISPETNARTEFSFNQWLQSPEHPDATRTRSVHFDVSIKTGTLAKADSKGNFYIKLMGQSGATEMLPMPVGTGYKTNFIKGATTNFNLVATDVGVIEQVHFSTDSTDGWFCESLSLTKDGVKRFFQAESWVQSPLQSNVIVMAGVEYDVTVKAGLSHNKASTLITVFGTRGATSQTLLASEISPNDWWTTTVSGTDVGGIKSALVTMEGDGSWYFEEMKVQQHQSAKAPVQFKVNRMMMAPGLTSLMIRPDSAYTFTIFTGSEEQAGTLGTAFVKVFGEFGEFEKHLGTGFKRGVAKEVLINAPYFGKLQRLQIRFTSNDEWNVESVLVKLTQACGHISEYQYTANKWLQAPHYPMIQLSAPVKYVVTIETLFPGQQEISAPASFQMIGRYHATSPEVLAPPFRSNIDRVFYLSSTDVGDIGSLRLQTFSDTAWDVGVMTVTKGNSLSLFRNDHGVNITAAGASPVGSSMVGTKVTAVDATHNVTTWQGEFDGVNILRTAEFRFSRNRGCPSLSVNKNMTTPNVARCLKECSLMGHCKYATYTTLSKACMLYTQNSRIQFNTIIKHGTDFYENVS